MALLGDNQKPFFSKSGSHWTTPFLFDPGVTQIVAPERTLAAQVWALGGGGKGGNTAAGAQQGQANAGGGGAGGIAISGVFSIFAGDIITTSIGRGGHPGSPDGEGTTVTFAPVGLDLVTGGGGNGQAGNSSGAGAAGGGGSASGGLINVKGSTGNYGNFRNGRGGGGGAPNNAQNAGGPNSGYQGRCMTDVGGIFAVLNAVGIGTPLCGPDSVRASDGPPGDRGSGGAGASRTRNSPNRGGNGGDGLVIIKWLVRN